MEYWTHNSFKLEKVLILELPGISSVTQIPLWEECTLVELSTQLSLLISQWTLVSDWYSLVSAIHRNTSFCVGSWRRKIYSTTTPPPIHAHLNFLFYCRSPRGSSIIFFSPPPLIIYAKFIQIVSSLVVFCRKPFIWPSQWFLFTELDMGTFSHLTKYISLL